MDKENLKKTIDIGSTPYFEISTSLIMKLTEIEHGPIITKKKFSKILTKGKLWGAFCEFKVESIFPYHHGKKSSV